VAKAALVARRPALVVLDAEVLVPDALILLRLIRVPVPPVAEQGS